MSQRDENRGRVVSTVLGDQPQEGESQSRLRREQTGAQEPRTTLTVTAGSPGLSRLSPRLRWSLFATALVACFYLHEIGHCAVAWVHGCPAIPTP